MRSAPYDRGSAEPQYLSAEECLAKALQAEEIAVNTGQAWTRDVFEKIAKGWREAALWAASQSGTH